MGRKGKQLTPEQLDKAYEEFKKTTYKEWE